MQTYGSSVVPMIEANYEMFTVVEKTIADFFISNEKEMDFSSGRMAKMLHVSEASLSRFAKKMGYSGYREFIYNYQPSIAERPNVEEQTIHVLYSYEELLQKTYSLIREPQIKHVSQLIGEHTRIFLYGFGSSGLAAQEFQLRLLRLGMDAEAITELHQMVLNEARITNACLVIGISLSGATRELIDALDRAKARGAAVIYLTSSNAEREKRTYEEIVLAPVKKNLEYGNVISPQFPILLILDLIYAQLLKEDRAARKRSTIRTSGRGSRTIMLDRCGFKNQIDRKNHTFILNV